MRRIKFFIKQFLKEPLWFKMLISKTLFVTIIFSSTFFANNPYYQSFSKLAAAIFFCAYGIKYWSNRLTSVIFLSAAAISIVLSILTIT